MSGPEVIKVRDAEAAAEAAADVIVDALGGAISRAGRADWATTGGSTPIGVYKALMARGPGAIAWNAVHTWWGDERFVPSDHPLSNLRPFENILEEAAAWETVHSDDHRRRIRVPAENVHPFRTGEALGAGRSADACAAELEAELRAAGLAEADGFPVFDLLFVGIGGDGHLLSVFPGSPAFESLDWALAIPAPTHIEPHVPRVTLNPATVTVARRVLAVVLGTSKADIVRRLFGDPVDPTTLPAQLAIRDGATWILDEAAAAKLPR
ncbi:MAG TPA: 6-phosphogluconolactonase [Candidatus Limnocylindrales bacterium]|nr:6-phosphogluconolactonase [Candidatus Limnocylindrales bacterium]